MFSYFRFSLWTGTKDLTYLENWFEWFKGLGIPVCITRNDKDAQYPYAVWRAGAEAVNPAVERQGDVKPNSERILGEIVATANGFEMYLQEVVK